MRSYEADSLVLSDGYRLLLTWDPKRGGLNRSPVYQALSESDGLLNPQFLEKAQTLGRFSRRIDAALDLALLVREVETGKGPTPIELWARAAKLMGLRESTMIDSAKDLPVIDLTIGTGDPVVPADSGQPMLEDANSGLPSTQGSPEPNSAKPDLWDFTLKLLARELSAEDRAKVLDGVRQELLETSRKIELLNSELRGLLEAKASFVRHRPLYECKCGPLGSDVTAVCPICGSTAASHPYSIATIEPDLFQIVEEDLWLELGVARLFDACGFTTYVGSHAIGLSGARHEVDIIAWDAGKRLLLLAETTTEQGSMNRVARALLRAVDIAAHGTAVVTVSGAEQGAIDFGRRHSIAVIQGIRGEPDQLRKWTQSVRSALGSNLGT